MYNLAGKYIHCLGKDQRISRQAFMLLNQLETFVNGAIMQANRLMRTRKSIDDELRNGKWPRPLGKRDFKLSRLRLDYHFYFICIGQIHRLLKRLGEILNDIDLKKVLVKLENKFPKEIRNDLEHIDERAVDKKHKNQIRHITDFGNFPGDSFSFDGKEYTVNKESVRELKLIYEEVIYTLNNNYASKDPNFAWREQSEKQIKRILSYIKRWRAD
jgi:hypothetical protein